MEQDESCLMFRDLVFDRAVSANRMGCQYMLAPDGNGWIFYYHPNTSHAGHYSAAIYKAIPSPLDASSYDRLNDSVSYIWGLDPLSIQCLLAEHKLRFKHVP